MELKNIFNTDNFGQVLNDIANNSFIGQKFLVVTTKFLNQLYKNKIALLKNNANANFIILEDNACNSFVFYNLVASAIEDNIGFIASFGAGNLCDIVKSVATHNSLPYILIPSAVSSGGYLLNSNYVYKNNLIETQNCNMPAFVIVDNLVIQNTPNKMALGALGELCGYLIDILDLSYLKHFKNVNVEYSNLKYIENIVKEFVLLPSTGIISDSGKINLFKALLKCQIASNICGLKVSSRNSFVMLFQTLNNFKLSHGEGSFICSMVLGGLFSIFFNAKAITLSQLPNIEKRVAKLSAITNKNTAYNKINIESYNTHKISLVFQGIKAGMETLSKKYTNIINNCFKTYKNTLKDKGFVLSEQISQVALNNALTLCPDLYENDNILTFMKNLGLLEFL